MRVARSDRCRQRRDAHPGLARDFLRRAGTGSSAANCVAWGPSSPLTQPLPTSGRGAGREFFGKKIIPGPRTSRIICPSPPNEGVGRRDRSGRGCGARSGEGVTPDEPPREPKPFRRRIEAWREATLEEGVLNGKGECPEGERSKLPLRAGRPPALLFELIAIIRSQLQAPRGAPHPSMTSGRKAAGGERLPGRRQTRKSAPPCRTWLKSPVC